MRITTMYRRRWIPVAAFLLALGTLAWQPRPAAAQERTVSQAAQPDPTVAAAVGTYCAGCHNGRVKSPTGVVLDALDPAHIADNADVWSRAYRQLQAGTMPPV